MHSCEQCSDSEAFRGVDQTMDRHAAFRAGMTSCRRSARFTELD
jgi:hypothetical protein